MELNCFGCKTPIEIDGSYAKTLDDSYFHEGCFNCYGCDQSLMGTSHYRGPDVDSGYYCKSDYLLRWGIECCGCHEFIEDEPSLKDDEGNPYHEYCLCCCECGISLDVTQNFHKHQDNFYCQRHYDQKCGPVCKICQLYIQKDRVTVGDVNYHEKCFACLWCMKPFDPNVKYFGSMSKDMLCKSCQVLQNMFLDLPSTTSTKEEENHQQESKSEKSKETDSSHDSKSQIEMETQVEPLTATLSPITQKFDNHLENIPIVVPVIVSVVAKTELPRGRMCLCLDCVTDYIKNKEGGGQQSNVSISQIRSQAVGQK